MKRVLLAFTAVVGLALAPMAAEHPKDGEHPAGKEHPAKTPAAGQTAAPAPAQADAPPAKPAAKPARKALTKKELRKEFAKVVEGHIEAESAKTGGAFAVQDDTLGKQWRLKLDFVHKNKIVSLGDDRYFACADFKTAEGGKEKVDLDFFVKRLDDGTFVFEKVQVHKVAGKPRYLYNEKNEQVPVK